MISMFEVNATLLGSLSNLHDGQQQIKPEVLVLLHKVKDRVKKIFEFSLVLKNQKNQTGFMVKI